MAAASSSAPQSAALRLSDLVGRRIVDRSGRRVGKLGDVAARTDERQPVASGILVRRHAQDIFFPLDGVLAPEAGSGGPLVVSGERAPFEQRERQILLARDVMDGEVVDLRGPAVVRVNDVLLRPQDRGWAVEGIDVDARTLLRRVLPRVLRGRDHRGQIVSWEDVELLTVDAPAAARAVGHRRLAALHPADIARVADTVPTRQATAIVSGLDDDLAADAMEEMIDEKQADVIERLPPARAATILEHMAPDAAVDVLAELQPEVVDALLQCMDPAVAAGIHALMTYPKDTAGGLMTTDYLMAPPGLRVAEASAYLRPQLEKPDWVYYIYVVADGEERRLLGVLTLRDLLLADPDTTIGDIMTAKPRQVGPFEPATSVARLMSEYNLIAVPVTDMAGRILGIVSVDDALELVLPAELRRRVPRVFS